MLGRSFIKHIKLADASECRPRMQEEPKKAGQAPPLHWAKIYLVDLLSVGGFSGGRAGVPSALT